MSTPKLDKYKETYNRFITLIVEYHNCHQDYMKLISIPRMRNLRRLLRELKVVEKELFLYSFESHQEMVDANSERLRKNREARAEKKRLKEKKK
jgi:hypothetical protein